MGTAVQVPQNDTHDTLIILNIHKWGQNFFHNFWSIYRHRVKANKIGSCTWEPIF